MKKIILGCALIIGASFSANAVRVHIYTSCGTDYWINCDCNTQQIINAAISLDNADCN